MSILLFVVSLGLDTNAYSFVSMLYLIDGDRKADAHIPTAFTEDKGIDTASPLIFTSGPPLLPGLMAASV